MVSFELKEDGLSLNPVAALSRGPGRTGVSKTAFLLSLAKGMSTAGTLPALIFRSGLNRRQ